MLNKLKIITLLILSLMLIFTFNQKTYSIEIDMGDAILLPEYNFGDRLVLPDGKLIINGESHEARKIIYFPSGKAYELNQLDLNEIGKYFVEYRVILNNKLFNKKIDFNVVYPKVSFNNHKSISSYGLDPTSYQTNLMGLFVSLQRGDQFSYNYIVDLNLLGSRDPFIELYVMPSNGAGMKDVKNFYIDLVDIYDENNYVRITGNGVDDDGGSSNWWQTNLYLQGSFSGGDSVGIEWASGNTHRNNDWGFHVPYSLYGLVNNKDGVGNNPFRLFFDLNKKQLHGPGGISTQYITDLSDTKLYENPWEGFTTGEVFIRIYADNYSYNSFDFMITKIGLNDLSEIMVDNQGPEITIDFENYDKNNLPNGIVNHSYKVFNAKAFDINTKEADVSVRVFKNYGSSQRYELNIINNRFDTKSEGVYTIEYSSYDKFLNKTIVLVPITVLNEGLELNFSLDFSDAIKNGVVGDAIKVATPLINEFGVGETNFDIKAKLNNETIEISNNNFRPNKAGTWEVIYTLTDLVGQEQTKSYYIEVVASNDPVFISDAALPRYIIANFSYTIPNLNAFDYVAGNEVETNIYVTDGSSKNKQVNNNRHVFVYDDKGYVTIKYVAITPTGEREVEYQIPIIRVYDSGKLDMAKYFASDSFTAIKNRNNITFTSIDGKENAGFTFINTLSVNELVLRFSIEKNLNKFAKLQFIISDSLNQNEKINVDFVKQNNLVIVYVNDVETPIVLENSFSNNAEIVLKYNNLNKTIVVDNSPSYKISKQEDGQTFNGFSSQRVYLDSNLIDISGIAALKIININGQTISNDTVDLVRPNIVLDGNYKTVYKINETADIYKALSFDVLSPDVVATISVRNPNNEYVTTLDGVLLRDIAPDENHKIKLDLYGSYTVTYTLDDNNGSGLPRFTNMIFVDDTEGPIINLQSSNRISIKVGSNLKIEKASATDNLDGDVLVYYYLVLPKGEIVKIDKDDLNYTVLETGTYKIRYLSIDSTGNTTILENQVLVGR